MSVFTRFNNLIPPRDPTPAPVDFLSWGEPWLEAIEFVAPERSLGHYGTGLAPNPRSLAGAVAFLEALAPMLPRFAPHKSLDALRERLPQGEMLFLEQLGTAWAGDSLPTAQLVSRASLAMLAVRGGRIGLPHLITALDKIGSTAWPAEALPALRAMFAQTQRAVDLDPETLTLKEQLQLADRICLSARLARYAGNERPAKAQEVLFNWAANMDLPLPSKRLSEADLAWISRQWLAAPPEQGHQNHPRLPADLPYWDHQVARRIFLFLGPDYAHLPRDFLARRSIICPMDMARLAPLSERASQARARLGMSQAALGAMDAPAPRPRQPRP